MLNVTSSFHLRFREASQMELIVPLILSSSQIYLLKFIYLGMNSDDDNNI